MSRSQAKMRLMSQMTTSISMVPVLLEILTNFHKVKHKQTSQANTLYIIDTYATRLKI